MPLLEISNRRGLLNESVQLRLHDDLETIAKMLSGLINGLDKRAAAD